MSPLVYIATVFLVTVLLSLPLTFPFWKVWRRIKTHHPDLWAAEAPLDAADLLASPSRLGTLLRLARTVSQDEAWQKKDPQLAKWGRFAVDMWQLLPGSFPGQVGLVFLLLYFIGVFTSLLLSLIGH